MALEIAPGETFTVESGTVYFGSPVEIGGQLDIAGQLDITTAEPLTSSSTGEGVVNTATLETERALSSASAGEGVVASASLTLSVPVLRRDRFDATWHEDDAITLGTDN